MRRIYKVESDYTKQEVGEIIEGMTEYDRKPLWDFAEKMEFVDAYRKEDGCFDIEEGNEITIIIADEWERKKMVELMHGFLDLSRYSIEDITDAVLLGEHSEKTYKGIEEHMKPIFDMYLDLYLDQDAVLDKINKYGMASLTERDKRVLEENI